MAQIPLLNDRDFEEEVKNSRNKVAVHFYSPWCELCKKTGKTIEALKDKFGKIRFYNVNVDESEIIAAQNRVKGIPSVLVFSNGEEIEHLTGTTSINDLENILISL